MGQKIRCLSNLHTASAHSGPFDASYENTQPYCIVELRVCLSWRMILPVYPEKIEYWFFNQTLHPKDLNHLSNKLKYDTNLWCYSLIIHLKNNLNQYYPKIYIYKQEYQF